MNAATTRRRLKPVFVEFRYAIVAVVVCTLTVATWTKSSDYRVITQGIHWLSQPGWAHMYARHSVLQDGPLTYALAALVHVFAGGATQAIITALAALLLLPTVWLVEQIAMAAGLDRQIVERMALIGGLLLAPVWATTLMIGHPEDVLATILIVLTVYWAVRWRPVLAGLTFGIGFAFEPWVAFMAALLFMATRRDTLVAVTSAAGAALLPWLPFLVADPGSMSAARPYEVVNSDSALHLFGVTGAPAWVRPVELLLCIAMGWLAVRRGRYLAVPMIAAATRLLVDPLIIPYYHLAIIAGAVLLDATSARRRPVLTLLAIATWLVAFRDYSPAVRGVIHLILIVSTLVVAFVVGARRKAHGMMPVSASATGQLPATARVG